METQYNPALKPLIERRDALLQSKEVIELNGLNIAIEALLNIGYSVEPLVTSTTPPKTTDFTKFKAVKKANTRKPKIPTTYNTKLKQPDLFRFAVNALGSATVVEAVAHIGKFDRNIDLVKLNKALTWVASDLNRRDLLFAVKEGKANRYFLEDPKKKESKQEEAA